MSLLGTPPGTARDAAPRLRLRILPPSPPDAIAAATERVLELELSDSMRFGRRSDVEVPLPFGTVSSLHARVVRSGNGLMLEDLGSANGTFLDGRRLPARVPQPLRPGDAFKIADVLVRVDLAGAVPLDDGGAVPESTATLARRLVADLFRASAAPDPVRVEVIAGKDVGQTLLLPFGRATRLGRAQTCDLVLLDDGISREHAEVVRRREGVYVVDLGSKNGVAVDGVRVVGEARWRDGQVLLIGATRLVLRDAEDRYLRQLEQEPDVAPAAVAAAPAPKPVATPVDASLVPPPVASPAPDIPASERGDSARTPAISRVPRPSAALVVGLAVLALVVAFGVWLALGG